MLLGRLRVLGLACWLLICQDISRRMLDACQIAATFLYAYESLQQGCELRDGDDARLADTHV